MHVRGVELSLAQWRMWQFSGKPKLVEMPYIGPRLTMTCSPKLECKMWFQTQSVDFHRLDACKDQVFKQVKTLTSIIGSFTVIPGDFQRVRVLRPNQADLLRLLSGDSTCFVGLRHSITKELVVDLLGHYYNVMNELGHERASSVEQHCRLLSLGSFLAETSHLLKQFIETEDKAARIITQ